MNKKKCITLDINNTKNRNFLRCWVEKDKKNKMYLYFEKQNRIMFGLFHFPVQHPLVKTNKLIDWN